MYYLYNFSSHYYISILFFWILFWTTILFFYRCLYKERLVKQMNLKPFSVDSLITLRKDMGSFPLTNQLPDFTKKFNVVPYYLGPHHDGFALEGDSLLVLESFTQKKKSLPYAYKCLFKDRVVYLVHMQAENIDPNFCFVTCNK